MKANADPAVARVPFEANRISHVPSTDRPSGREARITTEFCGAEVYVGEIKSLVLYQLSYRPTSR